VTVDTAIRLRLLGLTAVTDLVQAAGGWARIYTVILPQGVLLPAIRIQRVGQIEPMHFRGPVNVYQARVQVDSVGASKESADAVDMAVQGDGLGNDATGLKGFKGSIGSPPFIIRAILPADVRETYDAEELRQYKIQRDFFVHFEGTQ
jgi:hypothetical protein